MGWAVGHGGTMTPKGIGKWETEPRVRCGEGEMSQICPIFVLKSIKVSHICAVSDGVVLISSH